MGKKNKILLLTDFSVSSIRAINFVSQGYNYTANEYLLLHINPLHVDMYSDEYSLIYSKAESILRYVQKINPTSACFLEIEHGEVIEILLKYTSSNQFDLIVSGTKGQTNEPCHLFGRTSINIIYTAPCPILTISEDINYDGIKHIIYFATFEQRDIEALKKIACLLKLFNAEITIYNSSLNYNDSYINKVNELREALDNKKITFLSVSKDETLDVIEVFSKHRKTDLICILSNNVTGLQKLFATKKNPELSYLTSTPFLIFPEKSEATII